MRKIINTILVGILILPYIITPSTVLGANRLPVNVNKVNDTSIVKDDDLNIGKKIADIKSGKKLEISQTINNSDYENERFVVFVKKNKYESSKKEISKKGGVFSNVDESVYGTVMAIPLDLAHMNRNQREQFLVQNSSSSDTVAIVPVQKRELSAVPEFNDPLYPTDSTYSSNKQWYLSAPTGSYLGIDAIGAWNHLDSLAKNYGGSSEVLVAVIDTGGAYETYSKYATFNKMNSPLPWTFTKASDFTDNIFVNSADTANNQIDDDAKADMDFCIDRNSNGECNAGELANYIDDRNGLNIVDWGKYWSRVSYLELASASVCTNAPYSTNGVKCVQNLSNTSLCSQNGLANYQYLGCYESDMGHPNDTNGHGTLVSNIIASKGNNGIGGVGIASGVSLMNIKIFGETYNAYREKWVYDSAYGDQIATAINYAVEMGVDIINMSFAGSTVDYYEKMAMDRAYYDEGVLLIAASGNNATSTTYYPAGYDSVMSVGASNKTGGRASYSNYGSALSLSAPVDSSIPVQGMWNTNINKALEEDCDWNNSLDCMSASPTSSPSPFSTFANLGIAGTSFASPQVVAVAALVKSTYPNLTASQIRTLLELTSLPSGSATYSTSIGHGVLNANNAVKAVDYRNQDITKIKRVFQTQVSSSGYAQVRYSDTYGAKWSNWITSGNIKSAGSISIRELPTISGRLVQVMRGSNDGVYIRSSEDFGYLNQNDSAWSSWQLAGYTKKGISTTTSGDNILVSWFGTNGRVYVLRSTDGSTWSNSPSSKIPVVGGIVTVDDPTNSKVSQYIRISTDKYLRIRTSADNGATWSGWVKRPDIALSDPTVLYHDGRVYQVIRSSYDVIVTRVSTDGGVSWGARNRTYGTTGLTTQRVSLSVDSTNNTILQTYRAKNNKIYSRYSTNNGATWSSQSIGIDFGGGVYALSNPSTAVIDSTVMQVVRGSNGYYYYRKSTNSGINWGGWRNKGAIKVVGSPNIQADSDMNRVYLNVTTPTMYIYTRISDDRLSNFLPWNTSVKTISGAVITTIEMENLDLSN